MNANLPSLDEHALLAVQNVSHSYHEKTVLDDISFEVQAGEFLCVVGPSGAGKTTLLQCLAGLRKPASGRLVFAGADVTDPPVGMAVVFQDYSRSLMPWLTVIHNIALPLRSAGVNRVDRERRAQEALREVGLNGVEASYPWQLSGGMQQRVAIARGLAFAPDVLLMDEPFASVDAQTRADLEDLVLDVRNRRGLTVVLVTHDIDEAVYLADRVLVLSARPAKVESVIEVPLGRSRDQVSTKATTTFSELRGQVYRLIKRPAVETAQVHGEQAS
jgi:NitT/TauT family transport system ATP-binding protein